MSKKQEHDEDMEVIIGRNEQIREGNVKILPMKAMLADLATFGHTHFKFEKCQCRHKKE